jgi:hypothetical protein
MAIDLQFNGRNPEDYYDIAIAIVKLLPNYDQLLLNYNNFGSQIPSIHLAYNKDNNRRQVMTLYNGEVAYQGLAKLK